MTDRLENMEGSLDGSGSFPADVQARLQGVIERLVQDPAYVGGLSAAVIMEGAGAWQGAAGYAARNIDEGNNLQEGGTPFTTETLSRVYSVTKTFTAALVLDLAAEGAFRLEDTIDQYLGQLAEYNPALDRTVTIRQLLAHESGYQDWEEEPEIQRAVALRPEHVWTPYELLGATRQVFPPGSVRSYSHNNYVFLGAILEVATGRPVEGLYRERFFEPLGLRSMYFSGREPAGDRGELAAPHDNISAFNPLFAASGQATFPDAYTNISRFPFTAITSLDFTGGGIVSNVGDVARWGGALFGGRATRPATLEAMLQSLASAPDAYGNRLGYGIKATSFISGAYDFVGHNGSAPGYRSVLFHHPEEKVTLAVLANFAGVNPYEVAKALYAALEKVQGR